MGDTVSIEFLVVFEGVPPSRTTPGQQKEGPRRPGGPGVAFSSIFEQFWGARGPHYRNFCGIFGSFFVTCSAYRFFLTFAGHSGAQRVEKWCIPGMPDVAKVW